MGRWSAVYIRGDSSTLAGGVRGVQMAWRSRLGVHRMLRCWSKVRLRRFLPGSFCRFSGKSTTIYISGPGENIAGWYYLYEAEVS